MTAIKLLLVEDEVLIVMDLEALVERLGHHVVGVSADGSTALELAGLCDPIWPWSISPCATASRGRRRALSLRPTASSFCS